MNPRAMFRSAYSARRAWSRSLHADATPDERNDAWLAYRRHPNRYCDAAVDALLARATPDLLRVPARLMRCNRLRGCA